MKIGIFGIGSGICADPAVARQVAQAAEHAGLESVWTGEHVVLPDPQKSPSPAPPLFPMLHPSTVLSYLAAVTERDQARHRHRVDRAAQSGGARERDGEPRRAVGRAADPRHRRRLPRTRVPRARHSVRRSRRAHRRIHRRDARVVARRRAGIRRPLRRLRRYSIATAAGAGRVVRRSSSAVRATRRSNARCASVRAGTASRWTSTRRAAVSNGSAPRSRAGVAATNSASSKSASRRAARVTKDLVERFADVGVHRLIAMLPQDTEAKVLDTVAELGSLARR